MVNSQGGTQQISEILADRVGRENIHFGEPVTSISEVDDNVIVHTLKGKSFRQKCKIVKLKQFFKTYILLTY